MYIDINEINFKLIPNVEMHMPAIWETFAIYQYGQ